MSRVGGISPSEDDFASGQAGRKALSSLWKGAADAGVCRRHGSLGEDCDGGSSA